MDLSDSELLEVALVENLQRKDLTPFEEADGFRALKDRWAYTHERIAEAIGKSRVSVTEALAIGRLPEAVKEECRRADIASRSFLLELGRLPSEDLMLAAVASWLAGENVTRDTLRDAKKNPGKPEKARHGALRKSYAFDYVPDDRRYRLSLVFHGKGQKRDDILEAIRSLLRQIEKGDVDLARDGRFLKAKKPHSTR